jgi:hypothetical protein
VDLSTLTRPGVEGKRFNVDLAEHFLRKLDEEAALRSITRQSLINVWLYERLEAVEKK